jgi:hypothetical protein
MHYLYYSTKRQEKDNTLRFNKNAKIFPIVYPGENYLYLISVKILKDFIGSVIFSVNEKKIAFINILYYNDF